MQHIIQSNNRYLTNNQIVIAGVLALTPFGVIGLPDFLVYRKKQATWHLIILAIAFFLCAIISMAAALSEATDPNATEAMLAIGGYVAGAIATLSYIWSAWEGAWILGHIETVRAQANNRYPSN